MRRLAIWAVAAMMMLLAAGAAEVTAQDKFTISFPFQAAGIKLPKGEYTIIPKDDKHLTLRQVSTDKEFQIPFTKRLPQPSPALAEPQLSFDMVGNFAPSYTEYITEYLLAEVWLPGAEGYLVHTTKGAHKTQIVKGQKAK